jgi:glycosyl transferase family 87
MLEYFKFAACDRVVARAGHSQTIVRIALAISLSSMVQYIRRCCSALIGRYLEPRVIRFTAISFIIFGLLGLAVVGWNSKKGVNILGSWTGGDYACFYIAGTILNEYTPDQLYDFHLQGRLLHALLPGIPATAALPFINPPFFALLFRPFALLPFTLSFLTWVVTSVILYIWGLLLIRKTLHAIPHNKSTMVLLLALSFEPFLMECAVGGNASAFGFFAIALALYFDRRGNFPLSGMSLGLCLYKPTFLLLIIPMLVIARRIKVLQGLFMSGILLAGVSYISFGKKPFLDYLHILLGVSQMSVSTEGVFRTFKYIDILSFFRLLSDGSPLITWGGTIAVVLITVPFLIPLWWRFDRLDDSRKALVWACTLTLTTVLNLHFAIYDSIIVVLAVLLTANVLYQRSNHTGEALAPLFRSLIILLYLTPWIIQPVTSFIKLQIFTVVLAATGVYQLILARRSNVNVGLNRMGGDFGIQPRPDQSEKR